MAQAEEEEENQVAATTITGITIPRTFTLIHLAQDPTPAR